MPGVGTQFASYRIEGVLGRGGMGVVYRATELGLERPVALKLIAPELAGDTAFRESFLRESRLAASIDHPGILPVYAAGEAEGELYLANRFVDGQDLRTVIVGGPLSPERALSIVGQVADALDAAHARGLVHRDVKPGNVLVDGAGHCYLADFGLTTHLAAGQTATGPGPLAGSLDYLAPEQIRGGELDGRTDQYALACVLYELLAGAPAFRRPTEAQTLWAHVQEDAPALQAYPELDPVLARALAKEQRERYETCNAFVDDARATLGLSLSPVAVRRRRRRLGRRLVAAGGAILAIAAAAVLAVTLGAGGTTVAPANSVGVVDASSGELERAVPVGSAPTDVAASDDWVWVLNSNDGAGTISKLDTRMLDAPERRRLERVRGGSRSRMARGLAPRGLGRKRAGAVAHRPGDLATAQATHRGMGADGVRLRLALDRGSDPRTHLRRGRCGTSRPSRAWTSTRTSPRVSARSGWPTTRATRSFGSIRLGAWSPGGTSSAARRSGLPSAPGPRGRPATTAPSPASTLSASESR